MHMLRCKGEHLAPSSTACCWKRYLLPGLSAASLPCPEEEALMNALCSSFSQACSKVRLVSPQLLSSRGWALLNRPHSTACREPQPTADEKALDDQGRKVTVQGSSKGWNICRKDQGSASMVTGPLAHPAASFSSCSGPASRPGRSLFWVILSDRQKVQARTGQADGTGAGIQGLKRSFPYE